MKKLVLLTLVLAFSTICFYFANPAEGAPPPTCNPVSFAPQVSFTTGNAPYSVAVGDFNGDGAQDLVTANVYSNNVSVFLGNGAGGFGTAVNYAVQTSPDFVAIGDFNGDGKQDLAVANANGSNTVSILLGNGSGGFGSPANFPVGGGPDGIAIGDFNGDGKLDLAIANFGSSVSILIGDGSGSFGSATDFVTGGGPTGIVIGDFNGDGKLDLATSNYYSGDVSVLLGNGTGGFSAPTNYGAGLSPRQVAIGDFNGDGKQDLAVANGASSDVSILLGTGVGGFSPAVNFPSGGASFTLAVGDFNGDGRQDIAVSLASTGTISVLLGNGLGGFGSPKTFSSASNPNTVQASVVVGDFNGDGMLDMAVANYGLSEVSVMIRGCSADTTPPIITPTIAGPLGNNGWYVGNVDVSWSVTDGESAVSSSSDCNTTHVAADTTGVTFTCSATSGGGTATQSVTVKRDATAPSVSCGVADGVWHAGDVSIVCMASDAISALLNTSDARFSLPTNVPAETETADAQTGSRRVCDNAGNCSVAGPIGGNKVDKKGPQITITEPTTRHYIFNDSIFVAYTCTDGGSLAASCVGTSASGGLLDTGSLGSKTFTVSATDNVGNQASASVSYIVEYRVPTNKDQCKNGGWQTLRRGDGTLFKNQGDCVSFVNTGH